jgi:hypothetical protein
VVSGVAAEQIQNLRHIFEALGANVEVALNNESTNENA